MFDIKLDNIINMFNRTYTCYKHIDDSRSSFVNVPGYCCANVKSDGLSYVNILGLSKPLYVFKISGLTPWPHDDITGMYNVFINDINKIKSELDNNTIYKIITGSLPLGDYDFTAIVRAYEPGWLWTPKVETGQIGESIVNVPVKLNLVDGYDLIKVIKTVSKRGFFNSVDLYNQAIRNGAKYNGIFMNWKPQ